MGRDSSGRYTRTQFVVIIQLGDDAMRTPADIAEALSTLAHEMRDGTEDMTAPPYGAVTGPIRDRNGNQVGVYRTRTVG
jgi:hypothetical protein